MLGGDRKQNVDHYLDNPKILFIYTVLTILSTNFLPGFLFRPMRMPAYLCPQGAPPDPKHFLDSAWKWPTKTKLTSTSLTFLVLSLPILLCTIQEQTLKPHLQNHWPFPCTSIFLHQQKQIKDTREWKLQRWWIPHGQIPRKITSNYKAWILNLPRPMKLNWQVNLCKAQRKRTWNLHLPPRVSCCKQQLSLCVAVRDFWKWILVDLCMITDEPLHLASTGGNLSQYHPDFPFTVQSLLLLSSTPRQNLFHPVLAQITYLILSMPGGASGWLFKTTRAFS